MPSVGFATSCYVGKDVAWNFYTCDRAFGSGVKYTQSAPYGQIPLKEYFSLHHLYEIPYNRISLSIIAG